jgi:hypothetical protein
MKNVTVKATAKAPSVKDDLTSSEILEKISQQAYTDYMRVGENIKKEEPIMVKEEIIKIQHGALAVKSIMAKNSLEYINLKVNAIELK